LYHLKVPKVGEPLDLATIIHRFMIEKKKPDHVIGFLECGGERGSRTTGLTH